MITKEMNKVMEQETARVKSLTFHPNKPIIISGHHSGVIKAWDYQMNVCVYDFLDHDGSVRAVLFHPRGDFFISGGDDKIIRIWNYTERRITNRLKGHDDFVRSLDFHPTKPWILSASDDQTIMIWNMLTGKLLATARGHCHYVMSAMFLGESLIVSGSLDQSIRIWDCKGLSDATKKSPLLPDIVIKQIVDGHDRGVNTISVGEDVFISGGDDRDIKIWEWSETSAWERESICNHQGPVTGLLWSGRYILSSGEDGLFSIFDTEKRKAVERRTDGRYWCVAGKENLYAAGHDSGFEIYLYAEPKIVCTAEDGLFYLKDSKIYFSNYKTEKILCKPKKDIVSICAEKRYLLIQYVGRFEVLENGKMVLGENGKMVLGENGEGTLFDNGSDRAGLIIKDNESVYRTKIGSGEKALLFTARGNLFKGSSEVVPVVNEKTVTLHFMEGGEKSFSVPFKPLKAICSESRIALIGTNDVSIYDLGLNLINTVNEMVSIIDGFFYKDIFIYATHKHLKYIFEDKGVLKSVEKMVVPFNLENNMLYFLSDDGIECVDIDMTEIKFKKAVIEGEDIAPLIEGGTLPGLAPLSYLIRQRKGAVALPYIRDNRQRFELCLSDSRLEECMEYCRMEGDVEMNRKLADAAIRGCKVEIAEECLRNAKDWSMLFMLYVCSKREDKLADIANDADDATRSAIMLYLEDKKYFQDAGITGGVKVVQEGEESRVKKERNEFKLLDVHKGRNEYKGSEGSVKFKGAAGVLGDTITHRETMKQEVVVESSEASQHEDSNMNHEYNADYSTAASFGSYTCTSEPQNSKESSLGTNASDSMDQNMQESKEEELCWSSGDEKSNVREDSGFSEEVNLAQLNLKEPSKTEVYPINDRALAEYTEPENSGDIRENINKGLMFTTEGKFSKAIQMFRIAMIGIAFEIKDGEDYEYCTEERRKIGAYISGLGVERARRKTESPLKNIMMVRYFASLPLEKEHYILASSTAIVTFRKYGNLKQAKELAGLLKGEAGSTKVIEKALGEADPKDAHVLPEGVFCYDVLDVKAKSKTCLLCFVNSFEGHLCTNCKVGVLQ